MRNNKLLILFIGLLLFSCAKDEFENPVQQPTQEQQVELIPREEIDEMILNSLQFDEEFKWESASDEVIWSALMHSDSILTIGYQPVGEQNVNKRMSELNIQTRQWQQARELVKTEILATLNASRQNKFQMEELEIYQHEVLPFIEMKVSDFAVIRELRKSPNVRYTEPLGYEVTFPTDPNEREMSDSGCGSNTADYSLPTSDYTVISPNAKASWHFDAMGVRQAWNYSTGSGITVGLIDTGLSPDQDKLNGGFNSGYSSGRFVERYGFFATGMWWWKEIDGPDDQCGHGTSMAGVIAAPRSNSGSSVGVAYNANLIGIRGTGDVVINDGDEKTGVADALVFLGNRSDVKIISMSIGDVFSNSKVADAIRYAYGKGKLIFCAAGTSTNFTSWYGVIFPATMDETVAVTGVKEGGYNRCDVCHDGSKVDFTVIMERAGSNNHPLSLAMSGDDPSTVGGSSVATATAAGIAALVWSKNPSWTRDQVLNRLIQTADLYPNRSSSFGWGNLNAYDAVR
jgi:serine protease